MKKYGLFILCLMLVACGQKGPLYLPDPAPAKQPTEHPKP